MSVKLKQKLQSSKNIWLVTGAAGFIGSHLVEYLLSNNQKVVGLDNFFSGKKTNLKQVEKIVGQEAFSNFELIEGSIEDPGLCMAACKGVDYVLHQAALGSVSRSIKDPKTYDSVNVSGFLNMLLAARDNSVKKFVYASSSSVYGDEPNLPKVENRIGNALSPYAISKYFDEKYAQLFASLYSFESVGLRYFNVFGPRQDPNGEYAAVIPRWINERLSAQTSTIFGDGTTSRDFCYVTNVVQANLLAAITEKLEPFEVFNVALGDQTSLTQLYGYIDQAASDGQSMQPIYQDFRLGDVKHSKADISLIQQKLGFDPDIRVVEGLALVLSYYREQKNVE